MQRSQYSRRPIEPASERKSLVETVWSWETGLIRSLKNVGQFVWEKFRSISIFVLVLFDWQETESTWPWRQPATWAAAPSTSTCSRTFYWPVHIHSHPHPITTIIVSSVPVSSLPVSSLSLSFFLSVLIFKIWRFYNMSFLFSFVSGKDIGYYWSVIDGWMKKKTPTNKQTLCNQCAVPARLD